MGQHPLQTKPSCNGDKENTPQLIAPCHLLLQLRKHSPYRQRKDVNIRSMSNDIIDVPQLDLSSCSPLYGTCKMCEEHKATKKYAYKDCLYTL
jgi:hypothetical protein